MEASETFDNERNWVQTAICRTCRTRDVSKGSSSFLYAELASVVIHRVERKIGVRRT